MGSAAPARAPPAAAGTAAALRAALVRDAAPLAGLVLAFSLFSLYTVLVKRAINDGTNPLVLAFLREIIATSVLLPSAYWGELRRPPQDRRFLIDRKDVGEFVLLGFAMIWGTQLLSALSLDHLSANSYALLAPSVPVFTLVVGFVTGVERLDFRERSAWYMLGAVLVTAGGAAAIALGAFLSSPSKDKGSVALGFVFLLGNKISVGTYPNLEKPLFKKYSPQVVVAWGYATGAVLCFISVVPTVSASLDPRGEAAARGAPLFALSSTGWLAIVYSALISSAFNYSLMAWVNKRTSPATVMSFYPIQSIATPVLSFAILGTPLASADAVGGVIIVCGLACLLYARLLQGGGSGGAPPPVGAAAALSLDEGAGGAGEALGDAREGAGGTKLLVDADALGVEAGALVPVPPAAAAEGAAAVAAVGGRPRPADDW